MSLNFNTKIIAGTRLPIIICSSHYSNKQQTTSKQEARCQGIAPSLFSEMMGSAIVYPENEEQMNPINVNIELREHLEKLISEIKELSKCKNILLIDFHSFQSQERTFQFFTHESHSENTSIGFILKGTLRDQVLASLISSNIKCEKSVLDHFKKNSEIHCYQIALSTKLLEDENKNDYAKTNKSKLKYAIFAAILAATTKMQIDAGEHK